MMMFLLYLLLFFLLFCFIVVRFFAILQLSNEIKGSKIDIYYYVVFVVVVIWLVCVTNNVTNNTNQTNKQTNKSGRFFLFLQYNRLEQYFYLSFDVVNKFHYLPVRYYIDIWKLLRVLEKSHFLNIYNSCSNRSEFIFLFKTKVR